VNKPLRIQNCFSAASLIYNQNFIEYFLRLEYSETSEFIVNQIEPKQSNRKRVEKSAERIPNFQMFFAIFKHFHDLNIFELLTFLIFIY
jgi:hypothetical protein